MLTPLGPGSANRVPGPPGLALPRPPLSPHVLAKGSSEPKTVVPALPIPSASTAELQALLVQVTHLHQDPLLPTNPQLCELPPSKSVKEPDHTSASVRMGALAQTSPPLTAPSPTAPQCSGPPPTSSGTGASPMEGPTPDFSPGSRTEEYHPVRVQEPGPSESRAPGPQIHRPDPALAMPPRPHRSSKPVSAQPQPVLYQPQAGRAGLGPRPTKVMTRPHLSLKHNTVKRFESCSLGWTGQSMGGSPRGPDIPSSIHAAPSGSVSAERAHLLTAEAAARTPRASLPPPIRGPSHPGPIPDPDLDAYEVVDGQILSARQVRVRDTHSCDPGLAQPRLQSRPDCGPFPAPSGFHQQPLATGHSAPLHSANPLGLPTSFGFWPATVQRLVVRILNSPEPVKYAGIDGSRWVALYFYEYRMIQTMLEIQPGKDEISTKPGTGGVVRYLSLDQLIPRANAVFGIGGWSHEIVAVRADTHAVRKVSLSSGRPGFESTYFAMVRIRTIHGGSVVSLGHLSSRDSTRPGALNTTIKGAVTDAIKRAFSFFGPAFRVSSDPKAQTTLNLLSDLRKRYNVEFFKLLNTQHTQAASPPTVPTPPGPHPESK